MATSNTIASIAAFDAQVVELLTTPKHVKEIKQTAVEIVVKLNDVTRLNKFMWSFLRVINDGAVQAITSGGDARISSMQAVHNRIVAEYLPYYLNALYANASVMYHVLGELDQRVREYVATKAEIEQRLTRAGANTITRRYYIRDSRELASISFAYFMHLQKLDDSFRDRVSLSVQVSQVIDEVLALQRDIVEEVLKIGVIKTDLVAPDNMRFTTVLKDQQDFAKDMAARRVELEKAILRMHTEIKTKLSEFTQEHELEPEYDFKNLARNPYKGYTNLYNQVNLAIERTMTMLQREMQSLEKIHKNRIEARQYMNLHPSLLGLRGRKAAFVYSVSNADLNMRLAAKEIEKCVAGHKDAAEQCAAELSGVKTKDARKIKGYINWIDFQKQITNDVGKLNELHKRLLDAQKSAMDADTARAIQQERNMLYLGSPALNSSYLKQQAQNRDTLNKLYDRMPADYNDLKTTLKAEDNLRMGERIGKVHNFAANMAGVQLGNRTDLLNAMLQKDITGYMSRPDLLGELPYITDHSAAVNVQGPGGIVLKGGDGTSPSYEDVVSSIQYECGNDIEVYRQIEERVNLEIAKYRKPGMTKDDLGRLELARSKLLNSLMHKFAPALSPRILGMQFLRAKLRLIEAIGVAHGDISHSSVKFLGCYIDCMLNLAYDYVRRSYFIAVVNKDVAAQKQLVEEIKKRGKDITVALNGAKAKSIASVVPYTSVITFEKNIMAMSDTLDTYLDIALLDGVAKIKLDSFKAVVGYAEAYRNGKKGSLPSNPDPTFPVVTVAEFDKGYGGILNEAGVLVGDACDLYKKSKKADTLQTASDFWATITEIMSDVATEASKIIASMPDPDRYRPVSDSVEGCSALKYAIASVNSDTASVWGYRQRFADYIHKQKNAMLSAIDNIKHRGMLLPEYPSKAGIIDKSTPGFVLCEFVRELEKSAKSSEGLRISGYDLNVDVNNLATSIARGYRIETIEESKRADALKNMIDDIMIGHIDPPK